MRLSTNLLIACGLFAVAAVLLFLTFTHKSEAPAKTYNVEATEEKSLTKYIEKVELQNEQERDQQEDANKLAKLAKTKKDSVECQFWKQQQTKTPNKRSTDKVTQFCELSVETQNTSSIASADLTR